MERATRQARFGRIRALAHFLWRGASCGRRGRPPHRAQDIIEGISELDGGRGRKCQACRHMNDGLLSLLRHLVDPFRKNACCPHGDDHGAAVERGADELIPVNRSEERRVGKECRYRWWTKK